MFMTQAQARSRSTQLGWPAAIAWVCLSSADSFASAEACAAIIDGTARLACYDSFFEPPEESSESADPPGILNETVLSQMPAVEARAAQELALTEQAFAITPHKPNYILPATYNANADYDAFGPFGDLFSDSEIKLQLSLKTRIIPNLWGESSVWVAYTQQSYWQLYADSEASAPFRETNYQPEVFWQFPLDLELLGWKASTATVAFNHQSNGRAEPLSRSWNRITAALLLDKGPFAASIKTWHRIEEDAEDDNNPNIEEFMGRIEFGMAYKRNDQTFSVAVKNNLSSDNRSGVELNWSFPLVQKLQGYVQIYSGYGENLIDMENYNNRIGIGIALTDWL